MLTIALHFQNISIFYRCHVCLILLLYPIAIICYKQYYFAIKIETAAIENFVKSKKKSMIAIAGWDHETHSALLYLVL